MTVSGGVALAKNSDNRLEEGRYEDRADVLGIGVLKRGAALAFILAILVTQATIMLLVFLM